jgi:squalene-hopene/tetraprenyl-beta-curcumene cyclase
VPDADDTPGALLALANLSGPDDATLSAASAGVTWLLNLQNTDGGMPTFCHGWTGLPFDRSSNDLTAHTLLAWAAWRDRLHTRLQRRIDEGTRLALKYIEHSMQEGTACWKPLWFGNQHYDEVANLTYGTSRVLRLARLPGLKPYTLGKLSVGAMGLLALQNPDGGWGGAIACPSSIEETALAIEGLADFLRGHRTVDVRLADLIAAAIEKGVAYLAAATQNGTHFPPTPIGFYFANLWYFEKLYPVIYTVAALTRVANLMGRNESET